MTHHETKDLPAADNPPKLCKAADRSAVVLSSAQVLSSFEESVSTYIRCDRGRSSQRVVPLRILFRSFERVSRDFHARVSISYAVTRQPGIARAVNAR
jgi:hypothetical protein